MQPAIEYLPAIDAEILRREDEINIELAERSLREFMEQGWPVVEPATPFTGGFHIDAIAEHLQAVTEGQLRNLLITMPPRHSKSLQVAVFWPVWEWILAPWRRWLFASYALSLSTRDSLKCRRVIESPWYQARWGERYQLTGDQNAKLRFENDQTGYRLATSVGAAATGEGGDRIVIDDPHNVQKAESDAVREATIDWWRETMSTRGNDPKTVAKVIVQQRVHERDLAGYVLEEGGWEHLNLPAEYEPSVYVTCIGWKDPRTEENQLLWPERFGRPEVETLKKSLGPYAAAAQLQQRPVPRKGGLFQRGWFPVVDAAPAQARRCRAWDFGATQGGGDYSGGLKLSRTPDGIFYIEHVVRLQGSPFQVEQTLEQTAASDGRAVIVRIPQDPGAAGKALAASIIRKLAGYIVKAKPVTGDKVTRAMPASAQAEAGNIRLVKGAWNQDFLDEVCMFPRGRHDDQVDMLSDAIDELTSNAGGMKQRDTL